MKVFEKKIQAAIQDPVLQSALDNNATGRKKAWTEAFETMPYDVDVIRQQAHSIRREVIENLDLYLEKFNQKAEANGFIIHRAADAEAANQIVIDIARQHNASLIAKSKTMVSEEIELNHSLEPAGIRPVETDLGEYIVQLRDERPGHIITPSVHLKRDQVGRTFEEHLGIPYTEDIQVLTDTARKTLRDVFLSADIGLSGVNLAIVEAGALGILTNEGNGRMVTNLPPVHIALLGIERLVPTYDDFCTLLAVLPRASTGQPITVYTQIIQGPRKEGETDGALERHIILVDNGRSRTQQTWLADSLMCIRCGACLNACPIFREIGGHAYIDKDSIQTPYSGPIGSVVSPALFGEGRYGHLAQASTLCGACKDACPVDIDLPALLLRARAGLPEKIDNRPVRAQGIGISSAIRFALKMFSWIASHRRMYTFSQKMAGVFSQLLGRSDWLHLPKMTGWGYSKDIYKPAAIPFRERWKNLGQSVGSVEFRQDTVSNDKVENLIGDPEHPSVKEQFVRALRELDGTVIECDRSKLNQHLLAELKRRDIQSVTVWDTLETDYHLVSELQQSGLTIEDEFAIAQAGITDTTAAVAETGSIILTAASGKPVRTSLLPPVHFVVLESSKIKEKLPQVFHMEEIRSASTVTIISGPSRTADIEMTLTIGVHGPGEVIVFLLD